ncbi:transglycosylase SLT domain-containing protein [Priestia megaterium]|uniref:transglycosylase SLT domain-containing protein n=1 Tax=Priestia megaterium TaxID=1404 RepID=UPI002E1CF2FF|nr:transglycosylase SLT domain-containing protein [Priestia megaterium]
MDPYIKNWSAGCGLRASDAVASLTMHRTKALEEWKGYLTQVRIFALNVFSGKYCIVFEGEITNRNWGDARIDTGEITFSCKGFYHWLNIPIPLLIGREEKFDHVTRFEYEAQNIDVEAVEEIYNTKADLIMKDKPIKDIIQTLFKKLYNGYYLSDDSSFAWANLEDRFKVMGDVIKEYRNAGYLDTLTFIRTTQIDSFYVYLNQVLTQLMFEFYQDRDGAFRIKTPSWSDDILKTHIIDEALVQNATGYNDWENEPTRVLVKGGVQDIGRQGTPAVGAGNIIQVPMGLYIGKPGEGEYFSQNVQVEMMFGTDTGDYVEGSGSNGEVAGSAKAAQYYLTEFRISTPFSPGKNVHDGVHPGGHNGIDLAKVGSASVLGKPIYSLTSGTVVEVLIGNATAGNGVRIKDERGYTFSYVHMQSAPPVSQGDKVNAGAVIGKVGSTGHSTGPHLDLKVKDASNNYVNPEPILKQLASQSSSSSSGSSGSSSSSGSSTGYTGNGIKGFNDSPPWKGKYASEINAGAKAHNLEPALVAAIITQESQFNPRAGSPVGARGLMQLMPSTSRAMGVNDPYNPAQNIMGGSKYIRQMINQFKKLDVSLAAYNAGPGNVQKYNGIPPFKETRNYVTKVTGYLSQYRGGKVVAGDVPDSSSSSSVDTGTSSSPNASTGGFSVKTSYGKGYTGFGAKGNSAFQTYLDIQKNLPGKEKVGVKYKGPQSFRIAYPLPMTDVGNYIRTSPNGVEHSMIGSIIEVASNWKEKFESGGRVGLMGINSKYYATQPNVTKKMLLDGQTNVYHGTTLFNNAYKRFTNKVTFALASLYLGDMTLVEKAIKATGAEDFSRVRNKLDSGTVAFVDKVIDKYTSLYKGDYIEGDPNVPIVKGGKVIGDIDEEVVSDPTVKDYESSYKPLMSDEERLYKVNLKVSEQLLIRYDVEQSDNQIYSADEMVERYAKYMMQLFRAESHGVNLTLSTCMPFLRPGFNAWFEPTRRNFVFYITRVTHQGSYGNGAFSTVTGGFVRDPKSYSSIEENIFVSDTYVKAADFGEVVNTSTMENLKKELTTLHSQTDDIVSDARKIPTLSKMYSSASSKETDYSTMWTKELSAGEIDSKIDTLYKDAPDIIKKRKSNLKKIVDEAADFFTRMLNKTKY